MTAFLSPLLQDPQFNNQGNFLVSGLIWFYEAGTTTPLLAYQDESGTIAWSNPIVLNARGETGGQIWLAGGQSYKMILETPPDYGQQHGTVISVFDDVTGVNDATSVQTVNNWIPFTATTVHPSSGVAFYVDGDYLSTFQDQRRLKITCNAGTVYGGIVSTAYNNSLDTTLVTVDADNGTSIAGTSAVSYGFVETSPSSIPVAVTVDSDDLIGISWDGSALSVNVDGSTYTQWPIETTQTEFSALTVLGNAVLTAANFPSTLANPGRINIAGLEVKWGQDTIGTGATTITFAAAFPTACLNVYLTTYDAATHTGYVTTLAPASFTAKAVSSGTFSWLAIGY